MTTTTRMPNLTASLAALLTLAAGAASAMDDMATMTCADFMAMSSDDRMMAMEAMRAAQPDAMASDGMASGGMASDSMATGDTMASGGAMAPDDGMAAMAAACEGHPDMMAADAMGAGSMAPAAGN